VKIGDKVYQYDNGGRIYESTIIKISKFPANCIYDTDTICFDDRAIGKSIFTSEAEAKKAFMEVNNANNSNGK